MTIIKGLRDYFKKCPLLKNGTINVDCLVEKPIRYCIETVPAEPVILRYTDGDSLNQYVFLLASREYYGQEVQQNIENSELYEKLSDWIDEQNKADNMPDIGDGRQPQRIETLTSGYLIDAQPNTARYQIQMRVIYYKTNGRY